jgi:hypothetical protein
LAGEEEGGAGALLGFGGCGGIVAGVRY